MRLQRSMESHVKNISEPDAQRSTQARGILNNTIPQKSQRLEGYFRHGETVFPLSVVDEADRNVSPFG